MATRHQYKNWRAADIVEVIHLPRVLFCRQILTIKISQEITGNTEKNTCAILSEFLLE